MEGSNLLGSKRMDHRRSCSDSLALLKIYDDLEEETESTASDENNSESSNAYREIEKTKKVSPPSEKICGIYNRVAASAGTLVNTEPWLLDQNRWTRGINSDMDPKKAKRIISNRISAHKARVKKIVYVAELEKKVFKLKEEVKLLAPKVDYHINNRNHLKKENEEIQQKIFNIIWSKAIKDREYEFLKAEKARLMQLYNLQQEISGFGESRTIEEY